MKHNKLWSYAPYKPLLFDSADLYINRIVPGETTLHFEWLENGCENEYTVFYRKKDEGKYITAGKTCGTEFTITGLHTDSDYEFYITDKNEKKSRVRFARCGVCFGTPVNYLHPEDGVYSFSGKYLCSPSIIRLPDGALLASMDVFCSKYPQNLTLIFRSDNDGLDWHYSCELFPCCWGKLFIHKNELYMLSCSTESGDILIGKSDDMGKTFCEPTVLFRGSGGKNGEAGIDKTPMPIAEVNGRLWSTYEWGSWTRGSHAAGVMSADVNSDLLDADSWVFSELTKYDENWEGVPKGPSTGMLEGTPILGPDGKLYNIMRYEMKKLHPNYGLALSFVIDTDNPGNAMTYAGTIPFDGNHSKFQIVFDDVSKRYYTIASRIWNSENAGSRNLLSLMVSDDLHTWSVVTDIMDKRDCNPKKIGFQYVDFFIENDDILFLCRTGMNNSSGYHDTNYSVFDRIKNFRNLDKS